ncbi:hypothetical protein GWK47_042467 [Chionoecetes opilio]|uniref:Uncharacterized protein n=1 Tax=Chionoecetes opilio TaxID=41210 RepID=A0A8J4YHT8_CHIOP|nr:hypothetical protein GWK47_042467 [Chionoecetes opilio]
MGASSRSRSPPKWGPSWAAQPNTLLGETASPKTGKCSALLPLRRVQRKSVKEAASLVTAGVRGFGGESTDPHAEEEPLCGEDPPAVRIMAELGSAPRSGALKERQINILN